jgi:hypothetical protein
MLSADAQEYNQNPEYQEDYDDYLVKPVSNQLLLEKVGVYLELDWITRNDSAVLQKPELTKSGPLAAGTPQRTPLPKHSLMLELKAYAEMGYQKGVNNCSVRYRLNNF